jgi:hypothetical protein
MSEIMKLLTVELPDVEPAEMIAAVSRAAQDIGVVLVRDEDRSAPEFRPQRNFPGGGIKLAL